MELHVILLWNILEVIWRNTIISAVKHQIEDGLLLTDISEYKRRIILPFLDQVQEEWVVLQGISSCALASRWVTMSYLLRH